MVANDNIQNGIVLMIQGHNETGRKSRELTSKGISTFVQGVQEGNSHDHSVEFMAGALNNAAVIVAGLASGRPR